MKKRRNWLKTTIAMLTLIATVLETGFSTVSTMAAEIQTEDGIVVNTDAIDDADLATGGDEDLQINVSSDDEFAEDVVETGAEEESFVGSEEDAYAEGETYEEAEELADGTLELSDNGITGAGYDEISVYVDTENLKMKDTFRIDFFGPDSASYNPVINNDVLDKTSDGRYDFENLERNDFTIRAYSSDDVIFSYQYNSDGYPVIVVESKPVEKVFERKVNVSDDGSRLETITGEGFESITVEFDTEDLSDKTRFTLYVDDNENATVDGVSAYEGIKGLSKDTQSVTIEDLEEEAFTAYVVAEGESQIEAVVEIKDFEDGVAVIDINDIATKRVYEYEDNKVYVRATLEKADAVPDDAYFSVTPLSQEAAEKYLELLNKNKVEDAPEYTPENTLLYDIAFYTDETKTEELEPEEGSVSLTVEFKQNQISEDLGVENKEDVEVSHFIEEGSKVQVETLEVEQGGGDEVVEVVTDSFSVFAFTGNSTVLRFAGDPGQENTKSLLDKAWLYGITANTWKFNGEAETSFAVKKLTGINGPLNGGQTGVNSSKAEGSSYQYSMVAEVDGNTRIKGYDVELTIPNSEKNDITHESGASHIKYVPTDAGTINSSVDSMINFVKESSTRLAGLDTVQNYSGLPAGDSAGKLTIDITSSPDGTYYIDVDKYVNKDWQNKDVKTLRTALATSSGLTIKKNSGQKVVFNIKSSGDVYLNKFTVVQGGNTWDSTGIANMSSGKNPVVEDLIFNIPNAGNVYAQDFAGVLIAPKATVKFSGVGGGWLICNTALSDAEWHFVNGQLPPPDIRLKVKIPVKKKFIGGSGNWQDGFTFKLEKIHEVDYGWGNKQWVVDNSFPARTITLNGGQSEDAEGEFVLEWNNVNSLSFSTNYTGFYTEYTAVHEEWYRISEQNIGARDDVVYNVIDPASDQYGTNSPNWYAHVFIYKRYDNGAVTATMRTARKDPQTYDWSRGVPCIENQPVKFINKQKAGVEFQGKKLVNNSETNVPDGKFEFSLYKYNGNNQFSSTPFQTKANKNNAILFDRFQVNFDEGTHYNDNKTESYQYYLIKETKCEAPYVADPSVYVAKVTIKKETNNKYTTSVKYFKFANESSIDVTKAMTNSTSSADFNLSQFEFNNTYSAKGNTKFYGKKFIDGRDFKSGDAFTFKVEPVRDPGYDYDDHNGTKTVTIKPVKDKEYAFEFEDLEYTLVDLGKTYVYEISEDETKLPVGVTCTTNPIQVVVTIPDKAVQENGKFVIKPQHDDATIGNPAEFKNEYAADGEETLHATKVYKKETKLSKNKVFTFILEQVDKDHKLIKEVDRQSVTGPGQVDFKKLEFKDTKAVGTYYYHIYEDPKDNDPEYSGVIFDNTQYYYRIEVTDGGDGKLVVKKFDETTNKELQNVNPEFINDYNLNPTEANLEGTKVFIGTRPVAPEEFTFEFAIDPNEATDAKYKTIELPADCTAKNGANGSALDSIVFDKIKFNEAGTFSFVINEVIPDPKAENVVYSDKTFVGKIEVKDDGKGSLKASKPVYYERTDNGDKELASGITFLNTEYGEDEAQLFALKNLTGRSAQPNEFTFVILDKDGKEVRRATSDSTVAFEKFTYKYDRDLKNLTGTTVDKVTTYEFAYKVCEVVPEDAKKITDDQDPYYGFYELNGVIYGAKEGGKVPAYETYTDNNGKTQIIIAKDAKVIVTRNSDTAEINATVADYGAQNNPVVFDNLYKANGFIDIPVTKHLNGREFQDGDTFAAQFIYENKVIDTKDLYDKGKVTATVEFNHKEYSQLNFDQDDAGKSFEFTIKEIGSGEGVENDKGYYVVTVGVSDNKNGTLNVVKTSERYYPGAAPEDANDVVFNNTYVLPGELPFSAFKTIKYQNVTDKTKFKFILEGPNGYKEEKENNGDGDVIFKNVPFTLDDVRTEPYEYTVREVIENNGNYIYDTTLYKTYVTVSHVVENGVDKVALDYHTDHFDKDGKLIDNNVKVMKFENEYKTKGSVQFPATKVLVEKDIKPGEFTFKLYDENHKELDSKTIETEVKAGKTASVDFNEIFFTEADLKSEGTSHLYATPEGEQPVYAKYYTIEEDIPEVVKQNGVQVVNPEGKLAYQYNGYTYDPTIYKIVVTIQDDQKGGMNVEWESYDTVPQKNTTWDEILDFFKIRTKPTHVVHFVNHYAAKGYLKLSALKVMTGKNIDDIKSDADIWPFKFILSDTEKGNMLDGKEPVPAVDDGSGNYIAEFDQKEYTEAGITETFYIREYIPQAAIDNNYVLKGVKFDNSVYKIVVTTEDNNDGKLTVKAAITNAVKGTSAQAVSVAATTDDDQICTVPAVEFENIYESKDRVKLGGHKVLNGFVKGKTDLGGYKFVLKDEAGKVVNRRIVIPTEPNDPVPFTFVNANVKQGEEEYTLEYTQADYYAKADHTYKYTVEEVDPNRVADNDIIIVPNVTYSDVIYDVTVVLSFDKDGLLKAEDTVVDHKTGQPVDPEEGLDFINEYNAAGSITIPGVKEMVGKNLENGAYTFVLKDVTGAKIKVHDENDNEILKDELVTVNAGANFKFEPIFYSQDDIGDHEYEISEREATDGSTKDDQKFTAKVSVKAGNDGKLDISEPVYAPGPIKFVNNYSAKGEFDLEGRKLMTNKPMTDKQFKFVLKDEAGNEIETVTNAKARMDLATFESQATFKFSTIKFTQEALKSADGSSYLKETWKYYTVNEEIPDEVLANGAAVDKDGKVLPTDGAGNVIDASAIAGYKYNGYIYDTSIYDVAVHLTDEDKDQLVKEKIIKKRGSVSSVADGEIGFQGFIKKLFGGSSAATEKPENDEVFFHNRYDSECPIDPPILIKENMGRGIQRGDFTFEINGPGLKSTGEEKKEWKNWKGETVVGYFRTVKNGYNTDGTILGPNGKELKEGELYVGDVSYKIIDLNCDPDDPTKASRTFEYTAIEVPKSDVVGAQFTPAVFKLTVTAKDNNDGTMTTTPAFEDLKWEVVNAKDVPALILPDGNVVKNPYPWAGSIDIDGLKSIEGRQMKKDDIFNFTIKENGKDDTYTKTITNTLDQYGKPTVVSFKASEIPFLNYVADDINDPTRNDLGEHTYTITEEVTSGGITYDPAVFEVTVMVEYQYKNAATKDPVTFKDPTDGVEKGKLNVYVKDVTKKDNPSARPSQFEFGKNNYFEFINKFKASGKTQLKGTKYIEDQAGRAALPNQKLTQFAFRLYQFDDAARTKGKTLVDYVNADNMGNFTLDIPEYTQDLLKNKTDYDDSKTLYYQIEEVPASEGKWTNNYTVFESDGFIFDTHKVDIDITVTNDGTDVLKIEKKDVKSGKVITDADEYKYIAFTNIEKLYTEISGTKTWIDKETDKTKRPDVTIELFSSAVGGGKVAIDSYTIKADAADYSYTFKDLPAYDSKGKPIDYDVREVDIPGYYSEKNGFNFFNTAGEVVISKVNADTDEPLEGATLAVYDGSTEIERWVSGTSAHVLDTAVKYGKTYTLREISAPEGFEIAPDVTFSIPADGSDTVVKMSDKPIVGSVNLYKRDATTREALAGAQFNLFRSDDTRVYATGSAGSYTASKTTSNYTLETDASGKLNVSNLPYGTYYFVETKAPEGYELSTERLGFTILKSGELVEVTYLNTKAVGSVRLRKVGTTGRSLSGALFELYARTPSTVGQAAASTVFSDAYYRVGQYRTNSAGEIFVDELPWDDYYFVEIEAPDGYEVAKDVNGDDLVYTFTISASTTSATIDLGGIVNTPTTEEEPPQVLGERIKRGGVVNGVLGVRAKPNSGVLGERIGPVTGDASNIVLWLLLLGACVATIVATVVTGKKKKAAK